LKNWVFFNLTSDAQLEHISGMLASITSLKSLLMTKELTRVKKSFSRGSKSLAHALGSNQSLKTLSCGSFSSMELKVMLEPLMPKNNNLQHNTTLTKLHLRESIGGKEGIETLVDMLCTNTSLLELCLEHMDELSLHDAQGVDNVLAILLALKTNKSLKRIEFSRCNAVGGYKVLGTMMDMLLENHNIQDIGLGGTSLEESGDADYVSSALSKRKKVKLWGVVQSMGTKNPTFGRVFLYGEPYAGKLYQHIYALQIDISLLILVVRFMIEVNIKNK